MRGRSIERALLIAVVTLFATQSRIARGRGEEAQRTDVALTVVCAPDAAADLVDRLRDIIMGALPGSVRSLDVGLALRFEPQVLFQLPAVGADRPTAWVVVEGARALIRTAAAGRERFVFRDLAVSQPLSELDSERIGQTLKVALVTVIEGGQGALGRAAAQAAAGVQPKPSSPEAATSPVAQLSDQARASNPVVPPQLPAEDRISFGLGAFMEIARLRGNFAYGPGVVVNALVKEDYLRAGVWISMMALLPHGISTDSQSAIYGASLRVGINLAARALPWLSLDLGAGYDWPRPTYYNGVQKEIGVYRIAVRAGPREIAGVRTALALIVEYSSQSLDLSSRDVSGDRDIRPALALELWWR